MVLTKIVKLSRRISSNIKDNRILGNKKPGISPGSKYLFCYYINLRLPVILRMFSTIAVVHQQVHSCIQQIS